MLNMTKLDYYYNSVTNIKFVICIFCYNNNYDNNHDCNYCNLDDRYNIIIYYDTRNVVDKVIKDHLNNRVCQSHFEIILHSLFLLGLI